MCKRRQNEKKESRSAYIIHKNMFLILSGNLDNLATTLFSKPNANDTFPLKLAH